MKYLCALVLFTIAFCGHSQYYEKRNEPVQQNFTPRAVTIELTPIVIQYGKYYFNDRRVTFDEIKLPLIAVKDKKIDHKMKVINTLKDFRRVLAFAPLIYLTGMAGVLPNAGRQTLLDFTYVMWGIVGFNLLYDMSITLVKRSVINRYNEVIAQPSVSVLPNTGVNLGVTIRF